MRLARGKVSAGALVVEARASTTSFINPSVRSLFQMMLPADIIPPAQRTSAG